MAILTDLVTWLELDDGASSTRLDSHSANDFTDNNTVGQAAGGVGDGADFEDTNSEYLSSASADFQIGSSSVAFAIIVKVESKNAGSSNVIFSKCDLNVGGREYVLLLNGSTDRFNWFVSSDGSSFDGSVVASSFGAPSTGTLCLVVCWVDTVNDLIGICVNDGTKDTAAWSSAVFTASTEFQLGARADQANGFFDGVLDQFAFRKGSIFTDQDITDLYNGGAFRSYASLAGGTITPDDNPQLALLAYKLEPWHSIPVTEA